MVSSIIRSESKIKFLSPPVLVWQAVLLDIKVKLDILTDIDMLLMV